jgi:predicted AlkP superfamily pyrophosphatase or phosphodiesterase
VEVLHYGAIGMIRSRNDKNTETYYQLLKKHARHVRVYKKQEIPDYLHFRNHPFIAPIVIVPDAGYQIESRPGKRKGYYGKGDHGYDPSLLSMHGIFVAHGPAFKKGFVTGTLKNIDLYPLMCKVLNIYPAAPVDGKLENIEFILKKY